MLFCSCIDYILVLWFRMLKLNLKMSNTTISAMTRKLPLALPLGCSRVQYLQVLGELFEWETKSTIQHGTCT